MDEITMKRIGPWLLLLLGLGTANTGLVADEGSTPVTVKSKATAWVPSDHIINQRKIFITRSRRIATAIARIDQLIRQPLPKGLTPAQVAQWHQQTAWLSRIRLRLATYRRNLRVTIDRSQSRSGKNMVAEMALSNRQFLLLQDAIQMESRKYQTLSNAARTRHDIAMAAIRNMRA